MKEILSQALSQNKPSMDVGELEKIVDSHSSWITSIIGYPRFRRIYMWLTSIGLPPHIFAEGLSLLSWGSEKSSTVSAGALSSLGARLGQVAFDGSVITHLIDPVFIDSEIKTLIAKNDPRILDASLSNYIGQRFAESVVGNFSNVVSTLSNIHQLRNTSSVAKFNEYLQKLTSGEIEPKTAYQRDLKRYSGSYLWWRNTYAIMLFVELILGVWKHYEFRQEIYRRLSTNMLATDSETNSDLDGLVRTAKTTGKINNIAVAEVLLGVIRRWMMNSSANQHIENAEKYRKKRERADKITARKKEHK